MNYSYAAKAISTAIGSGLIAAMAYPHAGWMAIALAVFTTLSTYQVSNSPKQVPEKRGSVQDNLSDTNRQDSNPDTVASRQDLLPDLTEPVENFYERVNA